MVIGAVGVGFETEGMEVGEVGGEGEDEPGDCGDETVEEVGA